MIDDTLLELFDLVEDLEDLWVEVVLSHRTLNVEVEVFLQGLPNVGS